MGKLDKDTVKQLKSWQKENAVRQDKVCKEYFRLIKERPEEQVLPELMERFDVKRAGTIRKWIQKRSGSLSPAAKAVNDVMVLERINSLLTKTKEFDELLEERFEQLDTGEGDWVAVEMTSDQRGESVKSVSKFEALKAIYKEKIGNDQEFFKSVRALMPQTVLNTIVDNRKAADQFSDEDLDKQLAVHGVVVETNE